MTTTAAATVLARVHGRGNYDMPWETRLVAYKGKHYLVSDEWTGVGQLRGEQYRPLVYSVPNDLVGVVAYQLDHWREPDGEFGPGGEWTSERWVHPMTHGDTFRHDTMDKLTCLGEMGNHPWMQAL